MSRDSPTLATGNIPHAREMLALTDIHDAFAAAGDDVDGDGVSKVGGRREGGVAPPAMCESSSRSDYVTPRTELDRYVTERAKERRRRERRARARRREADEDRADAERDSGGSERIMRKAVNASFTVATGFAIHYAASELLKSYLDSSFASSSTRAWSTASYPVAMIVALWWLRKNGDDAAARR